MTISPVSNTFPSLTYIISLAKKGRDLSSILITKIGSGRNKRRKLNDGSAEADDEDFKIQKVLNVVHANPYLQP